MVTVKINEEDLVEMLVARVEYWTEERAVIELYEKMYEHYVYGGCLDGMELDIRYIVDNDYINYCRVIDESDGEDFEELKRIYEDQGEGDCSCETDICDFIEAVDDEADPTCFLVR